MLIIKKYFKSFSTQLGCLMGFLYYVSYALPQHQWNNAYLIALSIFIAFFSPFYSKISNRIDEEICLFSASVFAGKFARFSAQYIFNLLVFFILRRGDVLDNNALNEVGGIYGISMMISLMSQGVQYFALALYNRGFGSKNLNVTVGVTIIVFLGACAANGYSRAQTILELSGIIFGIVGLFYSLYTDLIGLFPAKGGIGLFFGTFNPAHKTHAKMISEFIKQRNLERVIIHPTLVPKVHMVALEKGQIKIKEINSGMRIYETTEKADVHVNYFMTGNRFYEVEHRIAMLTEMIKEAGLESVVEIWNEETIYNKHGFYGVISEVKRSYPKKKIHGLHGSDVGGMLVRAIYDESFGIIPCAIRRTDNISATAIRAGVKGMAPQAVEEYISNLKIQTA